MIKHVWLMTLVISIHLWGCGVLFSGMERGESYEGATCVSIHWVREIRNRGGEILLEDGSLWRISPFDAVAATTLTAGQAVAVCPGRRGSRYRYEVRISVEPRRELKLEVEYGGGMTRRSSN